MVLDGTLYGEVELPAPKLLRLHSPASLCGLTEIAFRMDSQPVVGREVFHAWQVRRRHDPFASASVSLFSLSDKAQKAPETYHAKCIYLRKSTAWDLIGVMNVLFVTRHHGYFGWKCAHYAH